MVKSKSSYRVAAAVVKLALAVLAARPVRAGRGRAPQLGRRQAVARRACLRGEYIRPVAGERPLARARRHRLRLRRHGARADGLHRAPHVPARTDRQAGHRRERQSPAAGHAARAHRALRAGTVRVGRQAGARHRADGDHLPGDRDARAGAGGGAGDALSTAARLGLAEPPGLRGSGPAIATWFWGLSGADYRGAPTCGRSTRTATSSR